MPRLLRERLPSALALATFCAIVPAAALHRLGAEEAPLSGTAHLLLVSLAAGAAAAAAIALTVVGVRRRDATTVLLGTAFSTMTALLALHALSTPGVIAGPNGVVAVAGGASLPVGAALLSLASLPSLRGPRAVGRLLVLQGVLAAGIVGLGALGHLVPSVVPAVPKAGTSEALAVLAVGFCFFALLTWRATGTFALTRRRGDLLVVLGTVLLAAALCAQMLLTPGTIGFYLGHSFELLGIMCIGAPVVFDLHRTGASRPLAGTLRACDLVASEEAFLGARVRSLLLDLEAKDRSVEQHTRRVALLAVQLGEILGLSPARQRTLAVGGLLHDVGKLAVPAEVLNKPGALTDAEFAQIKCHPEAGHALLAGFPDAVRRVVLDHHERLDGWGYPRGVDAAALDLETRILTVCDVYDALVSDRVYRAAWTHAAALELLHGDAGTAFDPRCVVALEQLLTPSVDPGFVADIAAVPDPLRRSPSVGAIRLAG